MQRKTAGNSYSKKNKKIRPVYLTGTDAPVGGKGIYQPTANPAPTLVSPPLFHDALIRTWVFGEDLY